MNLTDESLDEFEERLGYRFKDRSIAIRALTHKSYFHEARETSPGDNETFEFLGDSVLGFVVGDALFRRFPELDEGALSKIKAFMVSASALAAKARAKGLGEMLLLGVGEEKSGGRRKDSLLANVLEAVIAGVYLDGGIEAAKALILSAWDGDLEKIDSRDLLFQDYKTALQEIAQARGLSLPEYRVIDEYGPDHEKRFLVEVVLDNQVSARGEGSSKKEAQQQAAKEALRLHEARLAPSGAA
ncbi:MAG: ribonuclease III [Thermoanaerobaculia bacterium]|nr:ribonuclease III [Thermoanaerobaculia bacterium]